MNQLLFKELIYEYVVIYEYVELCNHFNGYRCLTKYLGFDLSNLVDKSGSVLDLESRFFIS